MTREVNSVIRDTSEFLNSYPPFSFMDMTALDDLSSKAELGFFKQASTLFDKGGEPSGAVYVIKKGAVELTRGDELIDRCDTGDIFGVRSALSGNPYLVNARVRENSLIYCIQTKAFKKALLANAEVNDFFLKGLASGLPVLTSDRKVEEVRNQRSSGFGLKKLDDISLINLSKELVSCAPSASIQEVAKEMS